MNDTPELSPEFAALIRKHMASRCRIWGLLIAVPSLLVLVSGFAMLLEVRRQRSEVAQEVMRLKAEAVRFGEPLEIHNPAWGTVIDGVDPTRFPSTDPRDGRRGALVHQYIPLSNEEQTWILQPRQKRR